VSVVGRQDTAPASGGTAEEALGDRAHIRSAPGEADGAPLCGAWLLDPEGFHLEFTSLWEALGQPDRRLGAQLGLDEDRVDPGVYRARTGDTLALRMRAAETWASTDPAVVAHVSRLAVTTPDDWAVGFEETHLGHWFRLILAAHLRPLTPAPDVALLRDGLLHLGWSSVGVRRVLWGRELGDLALQIAPDTYGEAVALSLGHGHKGWLDHDDVVEARQRLETTDRGLFRGHPELVPACEHLWELLGAAANPGNLLVLASGH
jgi:hypothetical protein